MRRDAKPFSRVRPFGNGFFLIGQAALLLTLALAGGEAQARDSATEALELRLHAEQEIAQELATGNPELAGVMDELLQDLLLDHLVTRDGTVTLDTVDSAYIEYQFQVARAMEEPGVAMALGVFVGPGSGVESDVITALSNLAGFHETSDVVATDLAVDVYEVQFETELTQDVELQIEQQVETAETDTVQLDARLEAKSERLQEKAVEKIEDAQEKLAELTEKLEDANEEAAEALEEKIEKAEEKLEKAIEKLEEKAEEKAEKTAEKAEEKAEKAAEKAEEKAVQAAVEEAEEKLEEKAEQQEDKADKKDKKQDEDDE